MDRLTKRSIFISPVSRLTGRNIEHRREHHKGKVKKMKKILSVLMVLAMMLAITACGGADTAETTAAPTTEAAVTEAAGSGETTAAQTAAAIPGLEDGVLTIAME